MTGITPRFIQPADKQRGTAPKKVIGRPFPPGVSGNPAGRPRGIDFRAVVTAAMTAAVIEQDVLDVYRALLKRAKSGDTQAAKVLLDRLCITEPPREPFEDKDPEQIAEEVNQLFDRVRRRLDQRTAATGLPQPKAPA